MKGGLVRKRDCDIGHRVSTLDHIRKAGARDTNDRERDSVDADLLADDGRIPPESPLPVPVADHRDGGRSTPVVRRQNRSSGRCRDSQRGVELAGDELAQCEITLAVDDEVHGRPLRDGEKMFEGVVRSPKALKGLVGPGHAGTDGVE